MKRIVYFGVIVAAMAVIGVCAFMSACASRGEYDRTAESATPPPRSGFEPVVLPPSIGDLVTGYNDAALDGLTARSITAGVDYSGAPGFDLRSAIDEGGRASDADGSVFITMPPSEAASVAAPPSPKPRAPGVRPPDVIIHGNDITRGQLRKVPAIRDREELWVIERTHATPRPRGEDDPTCGTLYTRRESDSRNVPVPLEHTDVRASITGYISSVHVSQKFSNPFSDKIEAVYVFPLPEDAGVNEFLMTVGDRTIRGIVREREEAQQIYTAARAAGYVASLMSQERPNIFTQRVANIEPGREIDISITYFNTLSYSDGWYSFVFPMVVGPRFNPPGTGDGVGAVARGDGGDSGQRTEIQYLAPGERSGHDISVAVDIEAGMAIEGIRSETHRIDVERPSRSAAHVTLASEDTIPNKDFVLSYRLAGEGVKTAMLTHRDERGDGYFTMMLVPPEGLDKIDRSPLEVVFVIDRSGSMDGRPIEQAREATIRGLRYLRADDTFQVINFSESASQIGPHPLKATRTNVERAISYVEGLDANGGTMMLKGLRAALQFSHDPSRVRVVAFLTDGYIGNESEILGALHKDLGDSRVFSFGVGSSVNRYLLTEMAKMGRGAAAFVLPDENAPDVMELFFDRISHPALADVTVDWGSARVCDVYPSRLPDLFVGRPVVITGRFDGTFADLPRVKGRAAGKEWTRTFASPVPVDGTVDEGKPRGALKTVWARAKITDLHERMTWDGDGDLRSDLKRVALDYGLVSEFTSFIAVDTLTRTRGDHGTTVAVPVPVPEGVRYETTVPSEVSRR